MTRQILDKAFGPTLLKTLEDYGKQRSFYGESHSTFQRGPSAHALGEEKGEEDTKEIDALAGTDEVGGKLQVRFGCIVHTCMFPGFCCTVLGFKNRLFSFVAVSLCFVLAVRSLFFSPPPSL